MSLLKKKKSVYENIYYEGDRQHHIYQTATNVDYHELLQSYQNICGNLLK